MQKSDLERARPLDELQLQYLKGNSVILLYHFMELRKELSLGICERKNASFRRVVFHPPLYSSYCNNYLCMAHVKLE